ncbi:MAG: hypothetical protein WC110_06715, partial [Bacteroidales bacterium]|nr:hypothetical protein [Bacteroidales bacterium]
MKRIYICLILSVFAVIVPGFGQTAQFLTVSPDSYSLSLGGTGVISPANAFAIYNNNAATALSPFKGAFAASYTMWQPTTTDNQLMSLSGFIKMGKRSAISLGSRL